MFRSGPYLDSSGNEKIVSHTKLKRAPMKCHGHKNVVSIDRLCNTTLNNTVPAKNQRIKSVGGWDSVGFFGMEMKGIREGYVCVCETCYIHAGFDLYLT